MKKRVVAKKRGATKERVRRTRTEVQGRVAKVREERERNLLALIAPKPWSLSRVKAERPPVGQAADGQVVRMDAGVDALPVQTVRGELEPEVIVDEDGRVRLAPLEWMTELGDGGEQ